MIFALIMAVILSGAVSASDTTSSHSTQKIIGNHHSTTTGQFQNTQYKSKLSDPINTRTGISYKTIQAAISSVKTKNGDTILVEPGKYPENVIVSKRLNLMSTTIGGASVFSFTMNSKGSGSKISGFNITGGTSNGIIVANANNFKIKNNFINNYKNDGIKIQFSQGFIISNNILKNNTKDGLEINHSQKFKINNNVLNNNGADGLFVLNSNMAMIKSNIANLNQGKIIDNNNGENTGNGIDFLNVSKSTIINNMGNNNVNYGILLTNGSNTALIKNNVNTGNVEGIYLIDSNKCLITNNQENRNSAQGIELAGSNNNLIKNNTAMNNTGDGIFIDLSAAHIASFYNMVLNNRVTGNINGFHLFGAVHNFIKNNIISKNNIGVFFDITNPNKKNSFVQNIITNNSQYGILENGTSTSNWFRFNRIVDNTLKGLLNTGSGILHATFNWWGYNNAVNVASQISNTGTGMITYNPWIILSIKAIPKIIDDNGRSIITADLLHDSNGKLHNTSTEVVPYTGPAHFMTTKGTINDVNFSKGKATSTLRNLTTPGTAIISARVDHQTVSTTVTVTA